MPAPCAATLTIKAVPGAARSEIVGWLGTDLKIRVAKPPERGKANREIEALVAAALDVPRSSVRIIRGTTAARKVVAIDGLTAAQVRDRLG